MRNRGTFFEQPEPNKALRTAYMKGYNAAKNGESKDVCPYDDLRTDRGTITFSRAFIQAWKDGWVDFNKGLDAKP